MLLVINDNVIQQLEGERAAVMDLYRKVVADTRHTDCVIISVEPVQTREFPT